MSELAPVEFIVIDFPGNRFDGSIAPALVDLVERGVVRILDLVFVQKDADGDVVSLEFDQLDEVVEFAGIEGDAGDVLSDEDILSLAESIPPDSSALFIVWEDLWAAELGRAIRRSGGEVVDGGRIPYDVINDIISTREPEEATS